MLIRATSVVEVRGADNQTMEPSQIFPLNQKEAVNMSTKMHAVACFLMLCGTVGLSTAFSVRKDTLFSSFVRLKQSPHHRTNIPGFHRSASQQRRPRSSITEIHMNFLKKILEKMKPNSRDEKGLENTTETITVASGNSSLPPPIETQDNNETNNNYKQISSRKQDSIIDTAQLLRDQAEKARMEARNLDLILTREKIAKLEKQLLTSKDAKQVESIKNQIKTLEQKLEHPLKNDTITAGYKSTVQTTVKNVLQNRSTNTTVVSSDDIQFMVDSFKKAPTFMQSAVLKVGGYTNNQTVNITAFAEKLIQDDQQWHEKNWELSKRSTFTNTFDPSLPSTSASDSDFSQEEIDEIVDVLRMVPQFMKNVYAEDIRNNDTAIALVMLKDEWKQKGRRPSYNPSQEEILRKIEEVKWIPNFVKGDNETAFALELIEAEQRQIYDQSDDYDNDVAVEINEDEEAMNQTIIASFPKRLRKEGLSPSESTIKIITEDLVKQNIWITSTRPEKVPGGFILRGSTKFENGDDLIDAIYKRLEKTSLENSVNIFYIADPTPVTKEEQLDEDRHPVLYITGYDISPQSIPPFLALVTATGFGTLWYTAIYPCILNENVQKMVEEQLALADSAMPSNFEWLNQMAVPIFFASLGIQASHELAHRFVAEMNGLNISIPTLVPSLVTGFTTAITSLKTPAKNKQALFDFALSGPLTGMIASITSLVIGLMLMQSMDTSLFSTLPALPIQVLRQSSLGGGIIEAFLPGILRIPSGSESSSAISSININLHPLVIAGFLGLQLNALALLPLGKTDGGRISTQLFGRRGAQLVSSFTMLAIFAQGLLGSDILLFYFSYVIFFESELELPAKNEFDDISFSRVLIATATIMSVLLTLIPM